MSAGSARGLMMAEETDVRFLGEQIKRVQGDVRLLRSDMVWTLAHKAKVRSDIATVRADISRVDSKLDAFRELVDDRFDQINAILSEIQAVQRT